MVATLVSGSNAENIAIDFERTVAGHLPLTVCIRRLDESTYVGSILLERHLVPTMVWGHVELVKFVLANASSIVLSRCWSSPLFFRHAAPLKSVRTANNTLFAIPRFLA